MRNNNFDIYISKLRDFYWKNGVIPSFKFMKDVIGISSRDAITRFFENAIEEGYIEKDENSNRYIPLQKLTSFNIYSSVSAGSATEVEADNIIDNINIEKYLIGGSIKDTILIEVKGRSMEDVGIMEGDIVIVDTNNKFPRVMDLIIGKVDGENFTLKRYMKDNKGKPYLKYENQQIYKDEVIYPKISLEVFGVVKGLIRRF